MPNTFTIISVPLILGSLVRYIRESAPARMQNETGIRWSFLYSFTTYFAFWIKVFLKHIHSTYPFCLFCLIAMQRVKCVRQVCCYDIGEKINVKHECTKCPHYYQVVTCKIICSRWYCELQFVKCEWLKFHSNFTKPYVMSVQMTIHRHPQIAKNLRSMSIRYRSDANMADRYVMDVAPGPLLFGLALVIPWRWASAKPFPEKWFNWQ